MTPEQIKELALAGVRNETIKAISGKLMNARRVLIPEFEVCEVTIRHIMKELDSTYITIALAENVHVEIAFCGDDGTEHEAEDWTLAGAFIKAKRQIKSMDKTF